jgi:hypothetical protein
VRFRDQTQRHRNSHNSNNLKLNHVYVSIRSLKYVEFLQTKTHGWALRAKYRYNPSMVKGTYPMKIPQQLCRFRFREGCSSPTQLLKLLSAGFGIGLSLVMEITTVTHSQSRSLLWRDRMGTPVRIADTGCSCSNSGAPIYSVAFVVS